jgi:predicted nucleic acid-binding protein
MKGWIFNASPLILLGKIQRLHLVEILSPAFRIPKEVVLEIGAGPSNDPTIKWLTSVEIAIHTVDTPPPPPFLTLWDLGAGETAVLSLALADHGSAVVLDDLAARNFAMTFDIPLLGTLGLLLRAKNLGLIGQLAPHIRQLESVGANLSQSVIQRALYLAGEGL